MATPVLVAATARFEPFLALAQRSGQPAIWLARAAEAGDIADETWPQALADSLGDTPEAQQLRAFLPRFERLWQKHAADYAQAADRLRAQAEQGSGDLGATFGFPLELDPRRRGLRSEGERPLRLAPNRLSAIHLLPSAFNPGHFWHLGRLLGGRQAVYLPCHDQTLAAAVTGNLAESRAAAMRAKAGPGPGDGNMAPFFAALGDGSRLAMAAMLARATLSAADLGRRLNLSPPAVSYHLRELRQAGLIDEHRDGASLQISLRRAAFTDLGARALAFLESPSSGIPAGRSRRKKSQRA